MKKMLIFYLTTILIPHDLDSEIFYKRCSTNSPAFDKIIYQSEVDLWIEQNQNIVRNILQIPIAFHVIYDTESYDGGYLEENEVNDQIDVLNNVFNNFNISFYLESLNYIQNTNWYYNDSESEYKENLAISPLTTLNIYTTTADGYLGYAWFPNDWTESSFMHGVVLSSKSLPGGDLPYDDGDTAVHEVGHYFGLYHTFEGGCSDGDQVEDTPAQSDSDENIFECIEMDTCPDNEGFDPIRNYMNYTDDDCIDNFTQGQIERMNYMISEYKPNLGCMLDECGICGGDNSTCLDCAGVPNGDAEDLGCGCNQPAPSGCDNQCGSIAVIDECGVCGGDSSSCDEGCGPNEPAPSGCDNQCGSIAVIDECGICGGDGQLCTALLGDVNFDNEVNVTDVVYLVGLILNNQINSASDINQDDITNITDIIVLIDIILDN